jgi:hypothetical protein
LRGVLFGKGFEMGRVDQTLFLLWKGVDILIVQVYVDDIIFGGSSHSLVARLAEDMSRGFEMSMMGELQFFLVLQTKQSKEGIFVHQSKYTKDILRKFKMEDSKDMTTLMSTTTTLDVDEEGEHRDQKEYWSMIGSLLYPTATRPDIQFSVCLCAHFQASPRMSISKPSREFLGICVTLWISVFGTPHPLLWRFMVFQTQIMMGVVWIRSPPLGLASS